MEFTSTILEGLPYRTVRKLGRGHLGEVYLISHLRNPDITAVVKTMDVEKVKEERVLEEFHLHRRLSRAGHENIVNMFWMHRTEDFYYLVMEDVEGESLGKKGKLEPAMAQFYFKQMIAGLKFIHGRGIIHGDIKPGNLLITKKGILKICDFGAAIQYRYGSEEMCVKVKTKTNSFAAPEIFSRGCCYKGPPLDIWSSGVTLLTMLTGRIPWERADFKCMNFRYWAEKVPTLEWIQIEKSAMDLLRKIIANFVTRWTIEQIEQSEWMQFDYGPIKKYKRKQSEESL